MLYGKTQVYERDFLSAKMIEMSIDDKPLSRTLSFYLKQKQSNKQEQNNQTNKDSSVDRQCIC